MTTPFVIHSLKTIEEMQKVQELENIIWDMDSTPTHQTFTAVKNGGMMLGAFIEDKIVGFSYGFPGYKNGEIYLCSHMLGIHPDYQYLGIGSALKEAQLQTAKKMGYELIIWTFDPLESRNAYLNCSKLYAICRIYLVNCYGEMSDGLNKGLPSDRFQIEWWINSERVEQKWEPKDIEFAQPFTVSLTSKGNPELYYNKEQLTTNNMGIEVPIPTNFQGIKKTEPALALDWRMTTREIFQNLFTAGYCLVQVRRTNGPVQYYQLVKVESVPLFQVEENSNDC